MIAISTITKKFVDGKASFVPGMANLDCRYRMCDLPTTSCLSTRGTIFREVRIGSDHHALEHHDVADGGIGTDLDDALPPARVHRTEGLRHISGFDFQVNSLTFLQVADYSKQVSRLWISLRSEHAHEAFTRFPEGLR